ncbi:type VI secretion system (T6SS) effector Hcp [Dyadobacter jejuensis]|uniref:Type VI secretion system (T6SS) effector Hcp n=1 Tax=Dyadobacter jejuensis TaxID=1082580 RepID=A0A316ABH9_9BACT|nr:type VI secretion system tube protein Hcp [Dyadobacter jejuensis]PWJ54779.1 type VI secretion system (T6SS) effector Hcp [Dyadobacter jejuensis]
MKSNYKYFFLLWMLLLGSMSQAQGIYMYIRDVTTGSGLADPHEDEVQLTSAQMSMTRPMSRSGEVTVSEYILTKDADISSTALMTLLSSGAEIRSLEIRYYDYSNTLVAEVELEQAFITSYASSSAACGGACPVFSESFSVGFNRIRTSLNVHTRNPGIFNWVNPPMGP